MFRLICSIVAIVAAIPFAIIGFALGFVYRSIVVGVEAVDDFLTYVTND